MNLFPFKLKSILLALAFLSSYPATAPAIEPPTRDPILRTVDLDLGQSADVTFSTGVKAIVKLLELQERRDSMSDAIRDAKVKVEVNGKSLWVNCANYNLPVTIGDVQIDCTVTKGYRSNSNGDPWGLVKDARLRLWPAGSPWIEPGTFTYPLKQRWAATMTQMSNEPTYVDGGDSPARKKIYYHYDLDFGGCERLVDVVAATDGVVVSSGMTMKSGYLNTPVRPRADVVYLLDDRGWYYRYSHLFTIDPAMKLGEKVKMGQHLGVLGKEGASGGWSHLHFGITCRQASGKWGTQEAYAFAWQAWVRENKPPLIAVARPHHFVRVGESLTLDAGKSWSASGKIQSYHWTFTDGGAADGVTVERKYDKPGAYSEILKITDDAGHVAYDFAIVQVIGSLDPKELPAAIHPTFFPTMNIAPGQAVTFKVRTFRDAGGETWDFGDGTPRVAVRSDGNADQHAKDGYAITEHVFARAGDYIVRVEHINGRGEKAIAHLWVRIGR
ncbi:MAG TPA: PKD domain-containing protein [Humisphaera sp.]|nr:PKD domain-containing protein [Humisphaera sp.]